jgi:hypothetical protein
MCHKPTHTKIRKRRVTDKYVCVWGGGGHIYVSRIDGNEEREVRSALGELRSKICVIADKGLCRNYTDNESAVLHSGEERFA